MQALNQAIREAIPHMQGVARENPQAAVLVRALRFDNHARWLDQRSTPVGDYHWNDMEAGGLSALGQALRLVGDVLAAPERSECLLPPVIALVTDGLPTDDIRAGLEYLMSKPLGQAALRLVIAIGEDAASNEAQEVFREFVANDALQPFQANHPEALVESVRWVATAALQAVSSPACVFARAGSAPPLQPVLAAGGLNGGSGRANVW